MTGEGERLLREARPQALVYCPEHRTIVSVRPNGSPRWCCEVARLLEVERAAKEYWNALDNGTIDDETKAEANLRRLVGG